MKLISMTDFVLEQEKNPMQTFAEAYRKCRAYAKFLKQPLTLGMFVPCDEEGSVLKECIYLYDVYKNLNNDEKRDYKSRCEKYQQAKEKVLFEGFEVKNDSAYFPHSVINHDEKFALSLTNYHSWLIEDLATKNLTLTQTALKQIGL